MKIHQNSTSFQPVTITLESKDELTLFVHLIGAMPFSINKKFNLNPDTVYDWYESLDMLLENRYEYPMLSITEVSVSNIDIHDGKGSAEVDWSKVPVGTTIEVQDDPNDDWHETGFHQYIPNMEYPFETILGNHWKYARLIQQ